MFVVLFLDYLLFSMFVEPGNLALCAAFLNSRGTEWRNITEKNNVFQ